jgi:hypothetical protein
MIRIRIKTVTDPDHCYQGNKKLGAGGCLARKALFEIEMFRAFRQGFGFCLQIF